ANNLYIAMRDNCAYKNNKKLPMLPQNIKLEESAICLNHYWLCENRHVTEKVMQSLVKDERGTRTYGSASLEFAHVAKGRIGAYLKLILISRDITAGKIIVKEVE